MTRIIHHSKLWKYWQFYRKKSSVDLHHEEGSEAPSKMIVSFRYTFWAKYRCLSTITDYHFLNTFWKKNYFFVKWHSECKHPDNLKIKQLMKMNLYWNDIGEMDNFMPMDEANIGLEAIWPKSTEGTAARRWDDDISDIW